MLRQAIEKISPRPWLRVVGACALLASVLNGAGKDDAYLKLVQKVSTGDLSIDFRALRVACADADHCDARGDDKDLIAMRRANQANDFKATVTIAEKLIAKGFPNIEAHAACAEAYKALGQADKAAFHHDVTTGLIRSIMSGGDGKTKETAFEVIGTQEEHIVLSMLGLPPLGNQSLLSGRPHSFDLIEVDDPKSGQKVAVYFNIDAFFPMKGLR